MRPRVSVVLPVRNEAHFIDGTIESLLLQQMPGVDCEILAVDGRSEDGTTVKLTRWARENPRVRLLDNPVRTTPAAMNIALREAHGDFVCVFGAHAAYPPDYIATCLGELRAQGAVGCSGRLVTRPANASLQARLVAWCLAHPFGSSGASVRTQAEGFVEHLPFPVLVKQALLDVGGFDETLLRNQDNDMSRKLRSRGGRLYLTAKTQATYFPRDGLARRLVHAFNGGRWNAITLRRNPRSMGVHHFVPLVFVLTLAGTLVGAVTAAGGSARPWWALLAVVAGLHFVLGVFSSLQVAVRERSLGALCLPAVFLSFHAAYGAGTLWGLLANLGRRVPRDPAGRSPSASPRSGSGAAPVARAARDARE